MTSNLLDLAIRRLEDQAGSGEPIVQLIGNWLGVLPVKDLPNIGVGNGLWQYQEVARAGLLEATSQKAPRPFADGLSALRRRQFFVPHSPPGFEADPIAIFAVAIGIRMKKEADAVRWLNDLICRANDTETDEWRRGILWAAQSVLGVSDGRQLTPVLRVALCSKGIVNITNDDPKAAQELCLSLAEVTPQEAVFRRAALGHLLAISGHLRLHALEIADVVALLNSAEAALRRWPWESKARTTKTAAQKWDIQSEYHVQALLWALLRPVFPDLKDEEYLKGLGYKHPRVDLAIPSLRLIVEVKFLYEATQAALAKITGEIAQDCTLYLSEDNGFDCIVTVVWDSTGSVQHHDALASGLRRLQGVRDAIVISRPGDWK